MPPTDAALAADHACSEDTRQEARKVDLDASYDSQYMKRALELVPVTTNAHYAAD